MHPCAADIPCRRAGLFDAEGLVIPTTLQGTGLAFLSMGFEFKGPTYVKRHIHVEIEVTEIKPTSKNPTRALCVPPTT